MGTAHSFWPWTIVPYWSIDLFYGLSLLICTQRLELTRQALRLLTAQVLCIACFLLFPLQFSTPRPATDGWAGQLFQALAAFDLPYNQAPSLHIVLLLILWDFYRRRTHGLLKGLVHLWSVLIGLSVLTTYQHHFIDVPTGLLAGALCLWLWPLEGERPHWLLTSSPQRLRLASLYGAAAVALAALASLHRAAWWLYWPALSLCFVALCYLVLDTQGFQKRSNGHHSLAVRLLMLPYRWAAWLNARWWTRNLPNSVQIAEGVWLGRLPLPWEADHKRFAGVVDVTAELASYHPNASSVGWLDLTEPEPDALRVAADAVEQARGHGPVLVCCALGFSRSAAVVIAWDCLHGRRASVADAVRELKALRPQVVLKPALLQVIETAVGPRSAIR